MSAPAEWSYMTKTSQNRLISCRNFTYPALTNYQSLPELKALINASTFFTLAVVCSGTQNGLSTTGTSDIQYNLTKNIYTNCEIVMGNLEITMMEHNRDFSFLKVRL